MSQVAVALHRPGGTVPARDRRVAGREPACDRCDPLRRARWPSCSRRARAAPRRRRPARRRGSRSSSGGEAITTEPFGSRFSCASSAGGSAFGSVGLSGAPVREAVRRRPGARRGARRARRARTARAAGRGRRSSPSDERGGAAEEREPGHRRRPAVAEPVGEVARPAALQQDPRDAGRAAARATSAASSASPPAKANGERHEPGGPPRLGERDRVREADEELGNEHQREDRDRTAEHERAPAAPRGEPRQRDERERGDRDRAGPARHLGGEPEVVRPS